MKTPRKTPGTVRRALIRVGEAKRNELRAHSNLMGAEAALEETRYTIFRDETERAYFLGLAVMDLRQADFAHAVARDETGRQAKACEEAMGKVLRRSANKKGRA